MFRSLIASLLLVLAPAAFAESPVTGRPQQMSFSRQAVQAVAAKAYHQTLQQLDARGQLDTDPRRLKRVRDITARLIAQAIQLKPAAATWPWEVHVTSDPQVAAYSMAGGKLLVGSHFIDAYQLNDGELAVALAHEIGHVIAEHVREQISLAASFEPPAPHMTLKVADVVNDMNTDISIYLRLQPLSRLQEMEADDIGIELAGRAGVAPTTIKRFYAKLTRHDGGQSLFDTHGSSRQRRAFAVSMASYAAEEYQQGQGRPLARYPLR